ncbi:hypothetical protein PNEG_02846 [Pneumocystis murina B123]|uniref:DNA-directed DNA polymerase n=1 Tax=Pneumocystis murina (strain B123) TaxID=1069680 RepID=M7PDX5_PNEMU|nr:hypothetical protein PNEG_02846 [Pneumocystis murina B123]EMR08669.1 hypothetical protein PNEG_02846 [Pneumocystis murina B123]
MKIFGTFLITKCSKKYTKLKKNNYNLKQIFKFNTIKKTFFSIYLKNTQRENLEITNQTIKYQNKDKIKKRFNELGIQHISSSLHSQLFPHETEQPDNELIELSRKHLTEHNLLGKNTKPTEDIEFDLPPLQGKNLDEHFYRIAMEISEPYLSYSKEFASITLPAKPNSWIIRSGWTQYNLDGTTKPVEYPSEKSMVFDVEVLYKDNPFAVIACAAAENAWYAWLSPWLIEETKSPRQLIPIGNIGKRIIIGHNIGYDRTRTKEEYSIKKKENAFIDTMSLHIAVNGMCSRQRSVWMKHKKYKELKEKFQKESLTPTLIELLEQLEESDTQELWMSKSSDNSLQEVAKLHCNIKPNKHIRNLFEKLDKKSVRNQLNMLMNYCANDVDITHKVYKNVFPSFLEVCPHPASFGALLKISSSFLPVNKSWKSYTAKSEEIFQNFSKSIHERLVKLINNSLNQKNKDTIKNDPWLKQLDWSIKPIRMVIDKKTGEKRPAKKQKKPGFPNWYKNLFPSNDKAINITVRSRIAPLLLRLNWEGHPLFWSNNYGWTFRVEDKETIKNFVSKNFVLCDMKKESIDILRDDVDAVYFKIPNKNGPFSRCGSPLSKSYIKAFEDGLLSSEISYAREALDMNAACSYWISSRERIMSQIVVWDNEIDIGLNSQNGLGIILPQIIPMGTITRRAVENTWLTASNIKENRVGSELKAMIRAPYGFKFVGADVDSEELWIASLFGDSQFRMHGATAIGWMTLEGTKSAETDMHSITAKILGISRDDAKVFNYSRIYGAGIRFAIQLLQRFNPKLSEKQAKEIAEKLYNSTKGKKSKIKYIFSKENEKKKSSTLKQYVRKQFWHGGTESYVFNMLEEIANQEVPQTPVLGCSITKALLLKNITPGRFMTSRINWAIQSSGVDYLHLLIISMEYLIERYKINARLVLTVHDEIRYLVHEEDKYILALALQISNLWTRAIFSQKLGINDVPQSCAFFSSIDIDHVLRKETNMDCITPSNPEKIPHGESLNIYQLLKKLSILQKHFLKRGTPSSTISSWNYIEKKTLSSINQKNILWLKAQAIKDSKEFEKLAPN